MRRLLTLVLLLYPLVLVADPYVGLQGGVSRFENGCEDFGPDVYHACEYGSGGIFLGFPIRPRLQVEALFVYLASESLEARSGSLNANAEAVAAGLGAHLTGHLPISDRLSILGQVGLLYWGLRVEAAVTTPSGDFRLAETENGTDPYLGLGAGYQINRRFGVRLLYQRFLNVAEDDISVAAAAVTIALY